MITKFRSYYFVLFLIGSAAIIFLLVIRDTKRSTLVLDAKENKFTLNFNLKPQDQKNLIKILENLNLPQDIATEFSFELDATTSASLTYLTPIKSKINIKDNSISFSGTTSHSIFSNKGQLQPIKVPKNANLIVYAQNLSDFVIARNSLPADAASWINDNFPKGAHSYLIVFGPNANYSLITKKEHPNIETLKKNNTKNSQNVYKVETRDDLTYHLINLDSIENEISQTLTFFEFENWQILASSRDGAFTIADSLKSKSPAFDFPLDGNLNNADFMVLFKNTEEFTFSESFSNFLFKENKMSENFQKDFLIRLKEIKLLNFSLMGSNFSGLIELK